MQSLQLNLVALTFVLSFADKATEAYLNKINAAAENTFIIYRFRNIVGKYINLQPGSENFKLITETLDKTRGDYFNLTAPGHN